MSESARRISLEPAFLLHHYPWRDTSRILELLTRAHGRVAVIRARLAPCKFRARRLAAAFQRDARLVERAR